MARRTIIAGNWKMNLFPTEAWGLIEGLKEGEKPKANLTVVVCPQAPLIPLVNDWLNGSAIQLGAQNCSDQNSGAFTGESSPALLKQMGCSYALAGHSERRELFFENDQTVANKTQTILNMGMIPIVCVGETLEERESGNHEAKIQAQVTAIYQTIAAEQFKELIFAYEPIWAIGTGKTATPTEANQIHQLIRQKVAELAGENLAQALPILYGGSVKADNSKDIMSQPDIDGVLVGGASLKVEDFQNIINSLP